jgi:predicted dehydrogenase
MKRKLRAAVVGVGYLGQFHAEKLAALKDVELVAVADADAARARHVAAKYGCAAHTDPLELIAGVDLVSIAVPTELHHAVARGFLDAGVHVLVEKPIARTLEEAEALVALALKRGALLAVGHLERFNPAFRALAATLQRPLFIDCERLSGFKQRGIDVDVVLDLMIHDLDLILSVVASDVERVEAVGVPVLTPRVDIANARVRFKNGCIANLTASRISRESVRKIRFFQRDAYVSIDTAARDVEMWSLVPQPGAAPKIGGGKLVVNGDEPLKRELEDFIAAVRDRRPPAVSGEEGRAALALAVRIVELMAEP